MVLWSKEQLPPSWVQAQEPQRVKARTSEPLLAFSSLSQWPPQPYPSYFPSPQKEEEEEDIINKTSDSYQKKKTSISQKLHESVHTSFVPFCGLIVFPCLY